jgi:hypothetical protein
LVQQNQFGGSATEDASVHLNTFSEICGMMHIEDVQQHIVKLRLFPFLLREKAKYWLLAFSKGAITSWAQCTNAFMSKHFQPAKTMHLRSNIKCSRQEERKPLALAWERMKESIRSCPNYGMEE